MTTVAWTMLGATWGVIVFFTVRFFWKVLTIPPRPDEPEPGVEGGGKPGAQD